MNFKTQPEKLLSVSTFPWHRSPSADVGHIIWSTGPEWLPSGPWGENVSSRMNLAKQTSEFPCFSSEHKQYFKSSWKWQSLKYFFYFFQQFRRKSLQWVCSAADGMVNEADTCINRVQCQGHAAGEATQGWARLWSTQQAGWALGEPVHAVLQVKAGQDSQQN